MRASGLCNLIEEVNIYNARDMGGIDVLLCVIREYRFVCECKPGVSAVNTLEWCGRR